MGWRPVTGKARLPTPTRQRPPASKTGGSGGRSLLAPGIDMLTSVADPPPSGNGSAHFDPASGSESCFNRAVHL